MSDIKLVIASYRTLLEVRLWKFFGLWLLFIFILQWAFAYEQLIAVWQLGPAFIPRFLVDGYVAFFANIVDFIPITITLTALFQAMAVVAIMELQRKPTSAELGVYTTALVASGCVACGTSVLTPVLSGLGSAASASLAPGISRFLLVVALGLAIISWYMAGTKLARINKK